MKHTLKITIILVTIFFITQVMGLLIIDKYIDHTASKEAGEIQFKNLPLGIERPPIDNTTSFIYIIIAILIGTGLVLLIIKFKKIRLWKSWYFLSVLITLIMAFGAFVQQSIAVVLALILSVWKIFKPNTIIHNLTEIFIYGGLAAIFVPIMNIFAAFMLLLLISIYDMIAVWKSKHMIKLAKFQTKTNVFAGLFVPYQRIKKIPKLPKSKIKKVKIRHAILGGGDIGFPLLFAGVVMKDLMLENLFLVAFLKSLIIPIFVTISLFLLFVKGKKDKFYPAMPFLTIGCIAGYLILLLI